VLVPLLAFDAEGRRLGYGGGYYDRTLAALRAGAPGVLAVGVAFSAQEAQDLPEDEFDERLDWIVTEKEARRFGPAPAR
jgi:5-formyltetrahydrofolate cyclo-ligase